MPTDEERREVADKLRDIAVRTNPSWPALMEALGTPGRAVTVMHLAYLIEPEERTCHDVSFDSREFVCSWCGCHIDVLDIESEPTMWLGGSPIEPSFCPNCGARVEEGE